MSLGEIAQEIGLSHAAVSNAMKLHGIRTRTPLESKTLRGNLERETQFPELRSKEWLEIEYITLDRTCEEIAQQLGCTPSYVLRHLQKFDIPRRLNTVTREGVTRSDRNEQLYNKEWLIEQYITLKRSPNSIAEEVGCSDSTVSGALARYKIHRKNPRPKTNAEALIDGRRIKTSISSTGKRYIRLWMPEHPNNRRGYVAEHRLICEQQLGRYLTEREVVHHLNDNSEDNRPENLMVFPDNGSHIWFENHPPTWMPRCECCDQVVWKRILKRPDNVPMEWKPE